MAVLETHFWYLLVLWWLSSIVGHLSAIWLLEENSEAELLIGLPPILTNKLGVRKGLLLNFGFYTLIISPIMAYGLSRVGNTNLAYLTTGIFLGSLLKQLISAHKEKSRGAS